MTETFSLGGVSLAVLIGAIVYVVKKLGVDTRWLPLVSLLTGAGFGLLAYLAGGGNLYNSVIGGGLIGLVTSGGYDIVKKSVLGNK